MPKILLGDWFERLVCAARELSDKPYVRTDGTRLRSIGDLKRHVDQFAEADLLGAGDKIGSNLARIFLCAAAIAHERGIDLSTEFEDWLRQSHEEFPDTTKIIFHEDH